MPTKSKQSGADELQATGLQAVARSGGVTSSPPSLLRRSSRPRSTLQSSAVSIRTGQATSQAVSSLEASPVDPPVKQESPDSAQPAVATLIAAPAQTKPDTAHSRKRKAVAHVDTDANTLDPAALVVAASKLAASKAAVPLKEPKRRSRSSAKIQPAQSTGSASDHHDETPASEGVVGSALQQPADGPIKPSKQRKSKAKAAIDTEATVIQSPGEPASAVVTHEDGNTIASETSSAKKVRKQKSTRVKVEVKTVEPGDDSATAQDSAMTPEDSAAPQKPRKRRAKAEVSVEELLESVHVTPYRERVIPKKWVGAHVSMGGGMERAVVRAAAIGKFP